MKIQIYYLSGNIGSIDTTLLSYQDGMLIDDAYLDASALEEEGLLLTRGTYQLTKKGRHTLSDPIAVVKPEELEFVGLVTVDGMVFLKREGRAFVKAIAGQLEENGVYPQAVESDAAKDDAEGEDQEPVDEDFADVVL